MDYMERRKLTDIVMRNWDKGDSVPQAERVEEIEAFKILLEDILPYNSPLLKKGALDYRWGKWNPNGKSLWWGPYTVLLIDTEIWQMTVPCWGPYAVFFIDNEIWRMAVAIGRTTGIMVLIMPPDADTKGYWDAYMIGDEQPLDEFIFESTLPTYQWHKKKRW